jgi:hypothetical protein
LKFEKKERKMMSENNGLINDLISEIQQLKQKVAELEKQQNQVAVKSSNEQTTSRRKLLKRMALLGLGATAATTALASTSGEANAAAVGTVSGASTVNYGLSAAPNGVSPYIPTSGNYGLIGTATAVSSAIQSFGVYGYSPNGFGVYGDSTSDIGVVGNGGNTGVQGLSSKDGIGGHFNGGKASLWLEPYYATDPGIPNTGRHRRGEITVTNELDFASNLYFCSKGDGFQLGTWVRLNQPYTAGNNINISPRNADGTFTISTPSNINLLGMPVRVAATVAPFNAPRLQAIGSTPSTGNTSTVQLAIAGTNGIPAGAKGVVGVLTNVGATAGGNLRFWTGGTAPNVANLNVPGAMPSLNLTASFAIPLDANGKTYLGFATGTVGATCGYVVDISGYWL